MSWQGNMDYQFCLDTYAVVTYLIDYLTKGDPELTRLLQDAINETKGTNDVDRLN